MIFLYLFLFTKKTLRRRLELEIEETVKIICKTLFSFPRLIMKYLFRFLYETVLNTFGLTKTLFTISTLVAKMSLKLYSAFSQTNWSRLMWILFWCEWFYTLLRVKWFSFRSVSLVIHNTPKKKTIHKIYQLSFLFLWNAMSFLLPKTFKCKILYF